LKEKSDAKGALEDWKKAVELQADTKIKAARSDNAPELVQIIEGWRTSQGTEPQFMTIASSYQNGPAERSIGTAEASMRAMLNDASLPLEFWDEAVTADAYLRNRTNTGPIIDRKITSPEGAWTGVTPSIDHIRVWGSKCYSYINPKTIPAGQRHDKLVNTGRIGVFVGYTSTTKQLRVYSPELGYTFRSSKVLIDENVKGGSIDLQLRNCISGPQGTLNVMPDRKPRGRPRKEIPGITPSALAPSMPALLDVQSTSQIVTPAFIPPPDVPKLNQNI
jgi:hypothetical protein